MVIANCRNFIIHYLLRKKKKNTLLLIIQSRAIHQIPFIYYYSIYSIDIYIYIYFQISYHLTFYNNQENDYEYLMQYSFMLL